MFLQNNPKQEDSMLSLKRRQIKNRVMSKKDLKIKDFPQTLFQQWFPQQLHETECDDHLFYMRTVRPACASIGYQPESLHSQRW
jgi:hypothetical protein